MYLLQDLLAEEGFKGRKLTSSRSSFGATSSSVRIRTERTRSDVSRYSMASEFIKTKGARSQLPRDNLLGSRRIVKKKELKQTEGDEGIATNIVQEVKRLNSRLLVDIPSNQTVSEQRQSNAQEIQGYKDIFSNDVFETERGKNGSSKGFWENEKYRNSSNKLLPGLTNFSNSSSKSLQKHTSSSRIITKPLHSRKIVDNGQSVIEPALDEVAVKATISILSGYIGRFLKDKEFQESIRDNCFSCLASTTSEESHHVDNKVMPNLEEAIETVERFVKESGDTKDLKKASFQLSIITSLNSKELKDGFMPGIPNAQLSACAHIYLSVIYKLFKKDKVSAKHLLQVFCDSPLQARTTLLPELWDYLFLPNLSHLKVWYDQEVSSIPDTSGRPRKLKLLEKVYTEILDSGTYQFAVYYKDWLTEGVEAPAVPSIHIPSVSVQGFRNGTIPGQSPELASQIGSVSAQPMISKTLYDSVFGNSNELKGVDEVDAGELEDNFDNCESSFGGTVEEDKRTVACSPVPGKYTAQTFHEYATTNTAADAPQYDGELLLPTSKEGRRFPTPREEELNGKAQVTSWCTTPGSTHMSLVVPYKKANDLILKKLAESVFQQQQAKDSSDIPASMHIYSKMSTRISYKPSTISSHVEEQYGNEEYLEDGSFFSSIPKDFICPLTGDLFEDPVTLETGQTFERMAIKEWFDKGKITCPITGKVLGSLGLPVTNFVLKRVIDSWKSEHCRNLLDFASKIERTSSENGFKSKDPRAVLLLEQLLTGFKTDERLMNAKHLISLGGLQFLILRFELGSIEEKSRIVVLLSCCIEADGSCRNYIAKNINKVCLLELLHNKQVKSRANAVMLLTELICLYRRTEITSFLSSMQKEGLMNTMHVLLVYLQSSPPDQRPLIAILLLHFDLLVEPRKYSIYREEAVDSITLAMECSITDEKVRAQCCRALLILGGHMSFSGELLIENWLLRYAGFDDGCHSNNLDNFEENSQIDKTILLAGEENAREDWWKNLTASLLGNGKKSFLEIISRCLGSGDSTLVRTCLITVAWLSQALSVLPDAEFQISAFSVLIPRLKESLESGSQVEHRVLASMTLLNFSRISECRVLLMTIGEEIMIPLQSLAVVTWTAKELHAIISGECRL
ncbi:Transducin/WD40 repeat-like superfamily protein [Thalictrum thalictroides]|uniref:RING-type E3 ubiquitin transferase n=1 Tax=Thalictrum thalictroides TaxID=46969 RepID=A0A7J6X274_THATH|nr:Transducin/WD40 repeat-like superfamily protein [Thalictrum thalictroides]